MPSPGYKMYVRLVCMLGLYVIEKLEATEMQIGKNPNNFLKDSFFTLNSYEQFVANFSSYPFPIFCDTMLKNQIKTKPKNHHNKTPTNKKTPTFPGLFQRHPGWYCSLSS